MTELPSPVWPVIVLAAIQVIDGLLCIKPAVFVAECFTAVGWPRKYWWMMPPVKFAAAAGLVLGVWVPYLGLVTCLALVFYFLVAIGMHITARDFGRNLFVNATGMLVLSAATGVFCFVV